MIKTINITNSCIEHGKRADSSRCPIALALEEVVSTETMISVGIDSINLRLYQSEVWWIRNASKKVSRFIIDFDQRQTVKPFKFNLNIPKKFLPEKS